MRQKASASTEQERRGHERLEGAVADNQGETPRAAYASTDADTVPGSQADSRVKVVEIVADAAEKQEDGNVQNCVDAVHKLVM